MPSDEHNKSMLAAIQPLHDAGFALHWLRPRSKAPIENGWSTAPVATLDRLRSTYQPGYNVGVRLGEPSRVAGGYLIAFDFDIRVPELANEVWAAFQDLFPDLDPLTLPCVASGSGGESRHLYAISEKPFRSKKLWTSGEKYRGTDGKWHFSAEIEMFASERQIAAPGSIHPTTGHPYTWLRSFDFDLLALGVGPFIPAAAIERLEVVEGSKFEFESRPPLEFKPGQLAKILDAIDVSSLDYDDWIRLGQALHHQTGASEPGWHLWLEMTRTSDKYDKDDRTMRLKWRSFGRYRGKPVTMATIVEWSREARIAQMRDTFEEEPAESCDETALVGLLGTDEPAVDPIDDIGSKPTAATATAAKPLDWLSMIDFTEAGVPKQTLHNVSLIVENDPRTAGVPAYNEFTQEIVRRNEPGFKPHSRKNAAMQTPQLEGPSWSITDRINGHFWSEDLNHSIRSVFEAPKTQGGYSQKFSDRDLNAAINMAGRNNGFHPVRQYLKSLTWDQTERVDTLFVDYLGAPNDRYHRDVAGIMLLGAVARAFEPGIKFDSAVILEGVQGKGKSTFIEVLAKHWFNEIDCDVSDTKAVVELLQGTWIAEISELGGFSKADVRNIKAFISRRSDKVRLAYAPRAKEYPRQSIFIGSTNSDAYLMDPTGGRRFLPVKCRIEGDIDITRLRNEIDQIWAEATTLYFRLKGNGQARALTLYLTDEVARTAAQRYQESRRVEAPEDAIAGQIEEWLNKPLQSGSVDQDYNEFGQPRLRERACLLEIWVECLGNERKTYVGPAPAMLGRAMRLVPGWSDEAQRRHRFTTYGQQRIYERVIKETA